MSVSDAQAETQAILANLTKGHEALLTEATNKAVKPMNFAWNADSMSNLKIMSENKAAFPVHDVTTKVDSFHPRNGGSPINTLKEFASASNWASESGANYISNGPSTDNVQISAGSHSKAQVSMPSQFAWKLLNVADDEAAVDEPAAESAEEEAPAAPASPTAAPGDDGSVAGSVTKAKDANPTYFAWKSAGAVTETEYDAKYLGAQSPERVEHMHKSVAPSLEGIIDQSVDAVTETEYDSKFVGTQAKEAIEHMHKSVAPSLEGIIDQNVDTVAESEYDAMTKAAGAADAVTEPITKGAASTNPSLEGVFGSDAAMGVSENVAAFQNSEAMIAMLNKVAKGNNEVKQSLAGIFKYSGVTNAFVTEYDDNFAPNQSGDASIEADTAAAQQDDGASSVEPASDASPEPETAPVPEPEPAAVAAASSSSQASFGIMDGGSSAADSIAPSSADAAAPAPEAEAEVPAEESAPVEEPAAASVPAAETESKYNAFQTTNQVSYLWPATAGQKPQERKPSTSDLVAGAMAVAPQGALLEADLDGQLAMAKKKMASEYDSKYAWPINSLNKRSYATGLPDSLWVLGTKGSVNQTAEKKEPKWPAPSTKKAECDHLSGAACVPDAMDALDAAFKGGLMTAGKATAAAMSGRQSRPESARIEPTKNMPVAGYVPGGPKGEVLVSKDAPVEGQIPALRDSLAPNPVSVINAMPMPRPPAAGGHKVGRINGAPVCVDPVHANPRYPQLSVKQSNRWETTAKSAYGNPRRYSRKW